MSIQAVSWALEQQIPGTAKLVLISLANCADHVTGHCWPSVERIAREASCSPRSVHTYIGALKRNGYIDVRSGRSKAGSMRTNDYWLLMAREPAAWDFGKAATATETQDIDDGGQEPGQEATTDDGENNGRLSATLAHFADGLSATGLQTNHQDSNHQESFPVEGRGVPANGARSEPRPVAAVSPQALAPPSFDPNARQAELDRLQAAEEARSKNQVFPVIEGTSPWISWIAHGHKPGLVTTIIVNGRRERGWYFRSLFPPKAAGPPASRSLMTAADQEELARGI